MTHGFAQKIDYRSVLYLSLGLVTYDTETKTFHITGSSTGRRWQTWCLQAALALWECGTNLGLEILDEIGSSNSPGTLRRKSVVPFARIASWSAGSKLLTDAQARPPCRSQLSGDSWRICRNRQSNVSPASQPETKVFAVISRTYLWLWIIFTRWSVWNCQLQGKDQLLI